MRYYWIYFKFLLSKAKKAFSALAGKADEYAVEQEKENSVLKMAAEKIGIEVTDYRGGMLELRKGDKFTFIKGNATEIESAVSHKIAGDKLLVSHLLSRTGLPVPHFQGFSAGELAAAEKYFQDKQNPVVIKPRRGTSGGVGITAGVSVAKDFRNAFYEASLYDSYVLVEDFASGENIRLLILGDHFLSAVRRVPAYVIGDGKNNIRQLILAENKKRENSQKFPKLWPIKQNSDCRLTLKRQGISRDTVPQKDQVVPVKTICNGHQGGVVEEVTTEIHEDYIQLSIEALRLCKVKFGGVDLIARDITRPMEKGNAFINEINTTPSFYGHYQAANQENVQDAAGKFLQYLFELI